MTSLLVPRYDHDFKGVTLVLLAGIVVSSVAVLFPVLAENVSADVRKIHAVVSAPKSGAILDNQNVDNAGLMLFPATNLNGALK